MEVPTVVLDGDAEVWVAEIDPVPLPVDLHRVLQRRCREAGAHQEIGDPLLGFALARVVPGQPVFEDLAHHRAPESSPPFELLGNASQRTQRHDLATKRLVDRPLDVPFPHDPGEVAQRPSDRGDGDRPNPAEVRRPEHRGLVRDDAVDLRGSGVEGRDLQRVAGEPSKPCNAAAERKDARAAGPDARQAASRLCSQVSGVPATRYTPRRTGSSRRSRTLRSSVFADIAVSAWARVTSPS